MIDGSETSDPLDFDVSGEYANPQAVAVVLAKTADAMKDMPHERRYDFEINVTEVSANGEDGGGES